MTNYEAIMKESPATFACTLLLVYLAGAKERMDFSRVNDIFQHTDTIKEWLNSPADNLLTEDLPEPPKTEDGE